MSISVMAGHSPSKYGRSSGRPIVPAIHVVKLACRPNASRKGANRCEKAVGWDDVDRRDEPGHEGEGSESLLPFDTEGSPGAKLATTVASARDRQIPRQVPVKQVRPPAAHPLRDQVLRAVEHYRHDGLIAQQQ